MGAREEWRIEVYEKPGGAAPVQDFIASLPTRHAAKIATAVERLRTLGPRLGFPDVSDVKDSRFRELRTRFAGQQYRVLYRRDGSRFVLFVAFHKTSERDLARAVTEADKYLDDYLKRKEA